MSEVKTPQPTHEEMHCARSKVIDAFAKLESAVITLIELAGIKVQGDPLGNKIAKLRDAKATTRYSNDRRQKVAGLLEDVDPLIELRNSIVHAPMKLIQIHKCTEALFVNSKCLVEGRRPAIVFQLEGLKKLSRHAEILADALSAPLPPNPASSPPPP